MLADIVGLIPLDPAMKPKLVQSIESTMTGVLYGQVVTAALQAALAAIGFLAAGVPHVLLWTVLTMIAGMLPVAGGALVWVPVGLSRLIAGDMLAGWGLIVYMSIVAGGVEHLLKPKLISGRSSLHPLAALVGVLGGLHFFGITGFLIGPMLLGLLSAMLSFYRQMPHYSNRTP
jgi:predicted PurR-regulated permease PerM